MSDLAKSSKSAELEAKVEIDAEVSVREAVDSQVTGVAVGQIHGEVNIFTDRPVRLPDEKALEAYLRAIKAKGKANQPSDSRLKPLWAIPFLVHPAGQAAGDLKNIEVAVEETFTRAAQMAWQRSVVILAEPGVGKSPALNSLLYKAADRALNEDAPLTQVRNQRRDVLPKIVLPISAKLRDMHGDLLSLLTAGFNRFASAPLSVKEMELLLERHDCLLLLDGLDEIPTNAFLGGVEVLRQFLEGHPHLRSVFTCRTASYNNQLGRTDALELSLLTEAQVKEVLGPKAFDRLPVSLQQLSRFRSVLEMIVRFEDERNKFESKGQLVHRLVRQRSGLENDSEPKPSINPAIVEGLLEKLAFKMFYEHAPYYSERQVMETAITFLQEWHETVSWREASRALQELDVFRPNERRQWMFNDRSTQAYFAAAAIVQDPDLLPTILDEAGEFSWRETLEILVGIADNPNTLLFELVDRNALVAAHCHRLARPPLDPRLQHAILDMLIDELGRENSDMREEIASFLSQNPLPDAKPALLEALKREWRSGVLLALARALLPLSGDHDYTPDDPCLWSDDIGVRLEGVVELWRAHTLGPRTGASDKAQLDEWRDAIEHHLAIVGADVAQPEMVRGLASMVLGCIGSDFARLTLLEAWQKGGLSLLNGWCVAEGLARINHPEVEDAVLAVADTRRKPANPAQELQQVWAFFILGWVGTQQKSAGLLFRTIKDKRKSVKVRGYAANAIGRLQPPEGRHRLEEALNQEEDAWVLKRIVQALGRAGTMESIPLLEQYLRSGRVQVRYTVRYAISSIRQRYELV